MSNFNVSILLKALDQATAPIGRVRAAMNELHEDERQARAREEADLKKKNLSRMQMNKRRREEARGEMLDAAGLAVALFAPIRAAMQFESAMADVKKVVDFEEPDGFKSLTKTIKQMGKEIPISQSGLAQIVASGGQLGIQANNLDKFARIAAEMSIAFDMTAESAGNSAAKLRNVFGLETLQDVASLGDAVNHLSNNSAATASEMVSAMLRAGGMARTFGITAAQTGALTSAFIALGKPPEVAGTAINAMLMKMQSASTQGKKFQAALKFMGTSAEELESKIANNAQGALLEFLETVESVDPQNRAKALGAMFGLEYADDLSLLVGSLDKYRDSLALVGDATDYAGSMTDEFNARAATNANNVTLMMNGVRRLGIGIGNALLPAVGLLVSGITELTNALAWVTETFPLLTQVVVTAGAVMIAGKVVSVAFGYGMLVMQGAVMSTSLALTKMIPVLRTVTALMIANPIGLYAAAIATAAYLIYDNWTAIKEFFSGIFDWFVAKVEILSDIVPDWVKDFFGAETSINATNTSTNATLYQGAPLPTSSTQANAQVGGELTIRLESDGANARVTNARTDNANFGMNVLSGQTMVMP